MFLDCAVEAKAQRCGLHPLEARATDVVGFGSRRETTSQKGPERGPSWQNLDNQRSLGTDAFAASDRMTFQSWTNFSRGKGYQHVSSDTVEVLEESGADLTNEQQGVRSRQKTMSEGHCRFRTGVLSRGESLETCQSNRDRI